MTSLNPLFTVENQMVETILTNLDVKGSREAQKIAVDLLQQVGIPDPEVRIKQFPASIFRGNAPARGNRDSTCRRPPSC